MATTKRTQSAAVERAPAAQNTAVATQARTAMALPPELLAELAAEAKDAAALERPTTGRISLQSGVMSYMGNPVPNNAMDCIVVSSAHRNVYYEGDYDADNIVNPNCFALSANGIGMAPHENVTTPEHKTCEGCPQNEWGSGRKRGKACKQTRRLALLPASVLDAEDVSASIAKTELALLDVSVTNVKYWANAVNQVAASQNVPMYIVLMNIKVVPDPKTQFRIQFTPLEVLGDPAVVQALRKRRDEASRMVLVPYDGAGGEADPNAGKPVEAPKNGKNKKF